VPVSGPPERSEAEFLSEINARLPEGVDWKAGAITYLREVVLDGGPSTERFHLVKPFTGGPDFRDFWVEAFGLLDLLHAMDLEPRQRVIDVGCGPGWTLQWLCKLGHSVVGLDISQELLDIAELRMKSDPFPPFLEQGFDYQLLAHDIEAEPMHLERPANVGIFASTLHHFYNPVAALRNVAVDLEPDAVIGVIEASAPDPGTSYDEENLKVMRRYATIERPYTREQLVEMLELSGFTHCEFLRPVNGLFRRRADDIRQLRTEVGELDNMNVVLASRTEAGLSRILEHPRTVAQERQGVELVDGFYGREPRGDGTSFRWAEPAAKVVIRGQAPVTLRVSTLPHRGLRQRVYAVAGSKVVALVELSARHPSATLTIPGGSGSVVMLQSDRSFSPVWDGSSDHRVLSFMVDVERED
jgi:SAM-dependent methyltransferase